MSKNSTTASCYGTDQTWLGKLSSRIRKYMSLTVLSEYVILLMSFTLHACDMAVYILRCEPHPLKANHTVAISLLHTREVITWVH